MKELRLNTLENTRRSFMRVIRAYLRDEIPDGKARTLGYLLTGALGYWKLEHDLRLEERLDEIERKLDEEGK